jgi:hypothetical protein
MGKIEIGMTDCAIASTKTSLPADDNKTRQERRTTLQPTAFDAAEIKEAAKQE